MKKFMLFAAALCCAVSLCAADDAFAMNTPKYDTFAPFQLGLFPAVPSWQNRSEVIGLKTGWPVCTGVDSVVKGFECSWVYSGSEYMYGVQASIVMNFNKHCRGFMPAVVLNISTRSLTGMQASCVFNLANNVRGVQAGGLNIANRVEGFQPGVLGNFAREIDGCQAGLYNTAEKLSGCQLAAVNVADNSADGFQIGFVNVASKGKGLQFGLVNVISGGTIPFTLFFNYSN